MSEGESGKAILTFDLASLRPKLRIYSQISIPL